MTTKLTKTAVATGLAVALGAGALAAVGPAYAGTATGTTAEIKGKPANKIGEYDQTSWYDTGGYEPTNPGPHRNVSLTAVANGPDIDFTLTLSKGPQTPSVTIAAGHRLDAFVRLDGAPNTRGTRFAGPIATSDAVHPSATFNSGATITGTFVNAGLGTHTLTLSDVLLDTVFGGVGTAPELFDTFYNRGTTADLVDSPVDWNLSTTVDVAAAPVKDTTKPVVKLKKPKKKAAKKGSAWKVLRGTLTDDRAAKDARAKVVVKAKPKKGKKATWVYFDGREYKKAKNKKKALKKSVIMTAAPTSSGAWTIRIGVKAPKGKILVQYWGTDAAGNVSKKKTVKQKITK